MLCLNKIWTDLGFTFTKGTYGPYCEDIKKAITILSNNNLMHEKEFGQMILITVNNKFKIMTKIFIQKKISRI